MRKGFAILLLLSLLGGLGYSVREAMLATPPEPPEILRAFGTLDEPEDPLDSDPIRTETRILRGWKVWEQNVSKYQKREEFEIHRERNPADAGREIRVFRAPDSYGARVRSTVLVLTGNAP